MMARILAGLVLIIAAALHPGQALADKWDDTIEQFTNAGAPAPYFTEAYGFAIFPTIGKGGVGIGGAYGEGRVYEQGKHVGNIDMGQLTSYSCKTNAPSMNSYPMVPNSGPRPVPWL